MVKRGFEKMSKVWLLALFLLFVPVVYSFDWGVEVNPVSCSFDVQAVCDSLNASSDYNLSSCEPLFNLTNCTADLGSVYVFVANESISANFSSYLSENRTLSLDCVSNADFNACMSNYNSLKDVISSNCSLDYGLINDGFNETCPVFDYQTIKDSIVSSNSEQTNLINDSNACIRECPACSDPNSLWSLLAFIAGVIAVLLLVFIIFKSNEGFE